jgi:hypothetical protein
MALWDSKTGFQLLKTEDKTQYFLNVEANPAFLKEDGKTPLSTDERLTIIKPFMELKEVGATWHAEEKGWLIPRAKFPFLALFMELISRYKGGVPPPVVRQKDKALIARVGGYESSILVSLCNREELLKAEQKASGSSVRIKLDPPFMISEEPDLGFIANKIPLYTLAAYAEKLLDSFIGMDLRYIESRDGKLQRGDLVYLNDEFVYTEKGLVGLERTGAENKRLRLPEAFTTPPFPIAYWNFEDEGMIPVINPNFDLKGTILELDDDAPKLDPVIVAGGVDASSEPIYRGDVKPDDEFITMRVTLPKPYKPFYVYFAVSNPNITRDNIGDLMRDPNAWYEAFDDGTIIGHLDDID